MTDELVEVSEKSGPHVVWRPGTNVELVVAEPCGGPGMPALASGAAFPVPLVQESHSRLRNWGPAHDEFPASYL